MFFRKSLLFIIVGLIAVLVIGCASKSSKQDESKDVAATVNGVDISMKEYQDAVDRMTSKYEKQGMKFEGKQGKQMLNMLKKQAINSLVKEEVLLQEANQKGYDISQEDVEKELDKSKNQFSSEEEFKKALKNYNLTEESYKEAISTNLTIEQFKENEIEEAKVSEEELKNEYDQYKKRLKAQNEKSEEDQEIPTYEEAKSQLESRLKQQKEQEQFKQIINNLMEKSEVEIFVNTSTESSDESGDKKESSESTESSNESN